jgi:hypothetical protein
MPWLAKSYFFTENPVWPFFNSFFGGKYWDEEHQEYQEKDVSGRELSIVNYIKLPWDLHVQIVEWEDELDIRMDRNL